MAAEPRILAACALAAALTACGERPEPISARPNVVLITIDTLRADHLGIYGYPQTSMPAVESWAERGVVFDDVYAPMSQTLPSHATMMTGVDPRVHGALENFYTLVDEELTLAELFVEQGYETFGAIGAMVLAAESGIAQGFEGWDQPEGTWDPMAAHPAERRASEVTDAVLEWAGARDDDRPAYLWVHYYDPHGPFEPPPDFEPTLDRAAVAQLVDDNAQEFATLSREGDYPEDTWWASREAAAVAHLDVALRFVADTWWAYLTEVEYTDRQIARLLDGLDDEGLLDDAVVAFVSDHGEGLYEHGEKGHGVHVWEELVRVPWIVARSDAAFAGRRAPGPAILADLAPTLLSAAGIERDAWDGLMDGVDLWGLLEEGRGVAPRPVFLERPHYSKQRMALRNGPIARYKWGILAGVVEGDGKLVREMNGQQTKTRREFFIDLEVDPAELYDRTAANPERAAALAERLDAWIAGHPTELPGTQADLSEERIRQLEALGYLK